MLISGVEIHDRKNRVDERGFLCEILRSDDSLFDVFGQLYMTTVAFGVVKAFHLHKCQTDLFFCPHGKVKLVLIDQRNSSATFRETNELVLSPLDPKVVKIPFGVAHGFMGLYTPHSIILNVPDKLYNHKSPDEVRLPAHDLGYTWAIKDR